MSIDIEHADAGVVTLTLAHAPVNAAVIALSHPCGATGARVTGHPPQWAASPMCIGSGQGAAALYEVFS